MENNDLTMNELNRIIKKFENNVIDETKTKKLKFHEFNDFFNVSEKIEEYLSDFTDELEKLLPKDVDKQSVDFLLYEVLINVYKHSRFKNAYVEIDNNEIINILIYDDGIGIPGSFKEAGIKCESDGNAIFDAINGKTTDKEKFNLHGRGLNSTARITTLAFEGRMIISSGNGTCITTKNGIKIIQNKIFVNGTFISIQINTKKIDNIYKYLKYEKINEEV